MRVLGLVVLCVVGMVAPAAHAAKDPVALVRDRTTELKGTQAKQRATKEARTAAARIELKGIRRLNKSPLVRELQAFIRAASYPRRQSLRVSTGDGDRLVTLRRGGLEIGEEIHGYTSGTEGPGHHWRKARYLPLTAERVLELGLTEQGVKRDLEQLAGAVGVGTNQTFRSTFMGWQSSR